MEKKYIDAELAEATMQELANADLDEYDGVFSPVVFDADRAIAALRNVPAADVQEVRHGKWSVGIEQNGNAYARCSACNRKMNDHCYGYPHCSMCGARMDGGEKG